MVFNPSIQNAYQSNTDNLTVVHGGNRTFELDFYCSKIGEKYQKYHKLSVIRKNIIIEKLAGADLTMNAGGVAEPAWEVLPKAGDTAITDENSDQLIDAIYVDIKDTTISSGTKLGFRISTGITSLDIEITVTSADQTQVVLDTGNTVQVYRNLPDNAQTSDNKLYTLSNGTKVYYEESSTAYFTLIPISRTDGSQIFTEVINQDPMEEETGGYITFVSYEDYDMESTPHTSLIVAGFRKDRKFSS